MLSSRPLRWMLAFLCSSLIAAGCSTTTDSPSGESGSLSLDLVIEDEIVINEVKWTITGNDMEMDGTIDTSAPGATASVEVFGLPATIGPDYTVTLEAMDESGEVSCKGDAEFGVDIGKATDVMVFLNCKLPQTLGGVRVNGKFNICAQLTKVTVSPLETSVGSDIDLFANAVDEEKDTIKYIWEGSGGEIADSNAPETTYTCGEVGEQKIIVRVSDDDFVYCMDEWVVDVTCVEGDEDLCEEVECDDTGNECTVEECDRADGMCKPEQVEDGTDCGDGGMCMDGECVDADLCEDVVCDDENECTGDLCNPEDGNCVHDPVQDGEECGDGGMCVEGECVEVDLCEGVECEDTGNECTVGVCNMQSGECDETNVTDGTECNGGAGACSAGECVDDSLCDGVECPSANECVQDGTCNPESGECVPGDPEAAGTVCSGGVCDGAGACVECNDASECPAGDQCNDATCVDNACGTTPVMNGTVCDDQGTEDGVCEGGSCVPAPECVSPGDCIDGNVCTTGDCVDGTCDFVPNDGAPCDAAGDPGTCDDMGACIGLCEDVICDSTSQCVQDGACDLSSGECIPGANEPEGTPCDENGGTACDGAGNCAASATECNGGETQTQTVQIGCTNGVTSAQSPFPNEMSITVSEPVFASSTFLVEATGVGAFPKFFLDAAQSTVPGGVRSAVIEGFNATVEATNGSGQLLLQADPAGIEPGLLQYCQYPSSTVCTQNSDCLVPPCNAPVLVANVPISEECGPGGVCEGLGQGFDDGPAAQCNITDPPEFCVADGLSVPLFAPGGSEVFTAGASGDVLFNWAADPASVLCPNASVSRCESEGGTIPDRSLALPPSIYGSPVSDPDSVGLNGIRLNVAGALFVALQCSAGQDGGTCDGGTDAGLGCASDADCPGSTCVGVGVDDDVIVPSDPASLPSCPIN